MKRCTHCEKEKPLEDFNKKTKSKDGYDWKCRDCAIRVIQDYRKDPKVLARQRRYSKRYNKLHKEQVKESTRRWNDNHRDNIKHYYLMKKYGIGIEQYNEILLSQNGRCAICRAEQNGHSLDVDHCHSRGHVRGILCRNCNLMLGKIGDSLEVAEAIVAYLKKHQ